MGQKTGQCIALRASTRHPQGRQNYCRSLKAPERATASVVANTKTGVWTAFSRTTLPLPLRTPIIRISDRLLRV